MQWEKSSGTCFCTNTGSQFSVAWLFFQPLQVSKARQDLQFLFNQQKVNWMRLESGHSFQFGWKGKVRDRPGFRANYVERCEQPRIAPIVCGTVSRRLRNIYGIYHICSALAGRLPVFEFGNLRDAKGRMGKIKLFPTPEYTSKKATDPVVP